MKALWTSFIMILYKSCTKNDCDTSCTFHGPTMTHQTDRIFNTQKQHHSQIRHLVWLQLFSISIPHWCISKTELTKRYVKFLLCKWKNCNTWSCVAACSLIQASCSEELPLVELPSWTKKDPTDLSEWFERSKSHRLKAPKKGCNACSRVAAFVDTSCTFAQAERSTRPDNDISNWQDLTRKSNTTAK